MARSSRTPPPELDRRRLRAIDLKVLRRIDHSVEEVLISAGSVAVYEKDSALDQWRRKNVEGSLFVVKRNVRPRFKLVVMNRLSTENLVENIFGDFDFDVQTPYLIYMNAARGFDCIWFNNPMDCEAVANIFKRIIKTYSKMLSKVELSLSSSYEHEGLESALPLSTASVSSNSSEKFSGLSKLVEKTPEETTVSSLLVPSSPIPTFQHTFSPPADHYVSGTKVLPTDFLTPPAFYAQSCAPKSTLLLAPSPSPFNSFISTVGAAHQDPSTCLSSTSHYPALAPAQNSEKIIQRSAVHNALLRLVKREDFIDMVYQEVFMSAADAARHL